jgi:hypothetical protein
MVGKMRVYGANRSAIYERLRTSKDRQLSDLPPLRLDVIYAIASTKEPDKVITRVVDLAETGEKITTKTIMHIVAPTESEEDTEAERITPDTIRLVGSPPNISKEVIELLPPPISPKHAKELIDANDAARLVAMVVREFEGYLVPKAKWVPRDRWPRLFADLHKMLDRVEAGLATKN